MLIITPKEKIDEYFESDALNQSSLKKLLQGLDSFVNQKDEEKTAFYEEKGHFIIGSGVDTLLTGEDGQFERQFYVSKLDKKPSNMEMSIIRMTLDDALSLCEGGEIADLSKYPGSIQRAIEEFSWQSNWKMDTKINKIVEIGSAYFEDLKKGVGKQILSIPEYNLIESIAFSLKSNSRTSKFFDRHTLRKADKVDVYYQLPIYFYYKGIYCKALLDLFVVVRDENGKTKSVQAFDLKTMNGSTLRFPSTLKSFRYDIQAAWYTEALTSKESNLKLDLGVELVDVLKPFTFIVESNNYPGQPLLFELDDEVLQIGKYGKKDLLVRVPGDKHDELVKNGVTGFDELLDTYIYQNENEWKEERIITKYDGVLKINWNGIKE